MTHTLAFCTLLGWTDSAIYQGYLTHASLNPQRTQPSPELFPQTRQS